MNPIFEFLEALAVLVTKALPSDEVKLERLKKNHPAIIAAATKRAERHKKQQIELKLKQLDSIVKYAEENNLPANELVMYLNGDTTQAKLVEKLLKSK